MALWYKTSTSIFRQGFRRTSTTQTCFIFSKYFSFFCYLWDTMRHIQCWPQTCHVVGGNFEHHTCLLSILCAGRQACAPFQVLCSSGDQTWAPSKHTTNLSISLALECVLYYFSFYNRKKEQHKHKASEAHELHTWRSLPAPKHQGNFPSRLRWVWLLIAVEKQVFPGRDLEMPEVVEALFLLWVL